MQILLQNTDTAKFVVENGEWMPDKKSAKVFPTGMSAYDYCRKNGLANMQIVMTFGDYEFDVAIPVKSPLRVDACIPPAATIPAVAARTTA